jgi:hypothetical protein
MTAIAAVIALSSTPLFAQNIEPVATPAPAIDMTPAPAAADTLAPAPAADTATTVDPLAPEAAAKPAVRKATAAKTKAAKKATVAPSRPAPARVASAAPTVAAAPAAVTTAPVVNGPPIEPLPPMTPEVAPVEAPVVAPPATADTASLNSMIPIAGAGGLGILALAGAGLVVRRRRRRAEDAEIEARQQFAEALPDAEPATIDEPKPGYMPEQAEPAFVRAFAPALAPLPATAEPEPSEELDGPVTELPEGFDLTPFGPHVQAAYKGPTVDNPSLSLKTRLRTAAGMDDMDKAADEAGTAQPAEAPAAKPAMAQQGKADFMLRGAGTKPSMRPVHGANARSAYSK